MANKLLGQHFLKNPAVAKKMAAAIAPEREDAVIEIGPGHGELTFQLFEKCASAGAKLAIIEKDAALAEGLRANAALKNVEITKGDILEILPALGLKKYKLIGNIPYYLTGHLLRIVSELKNAPERAVFMLQKEVAERMLAKPPEMNRLAASVQFWAMPKIIGRVPKEDFSPAPKVDSAIILLEKKSADRASATQSQSESEIYYAAVRALFAQPRKTILNNLSAAKPDMKKNDVAEKLEAAKIDPKARPQNLRIEDIQAIARVFWG